MRILVTGSDGQVGWELSHALAAEHELLCVNRARMDLTKPAAIRQTIRDFRPDLIVNAAAYTAVDRAEDEPALAHAINGTAVGIIGEEARRAGAAVIHYSTDYVFDGGKRAPYAIDDPPNPLNVYGSSKLAGEKMLLDSGANALILRTSWVYGLRGRNFLLAILRQAAIKSELRIVNDQIGCPTWCRAIAQATARIIKRAVAGDRGRRNFGGREGVYHLAAGGCTTWFDFARRIFDLAELSPMPRMIPISTEAFGAKAKRPLYSVLNCSTTANTFDVLMADWTLMLDEVMHDNAARAVLAGTTLTGPPNEPHQPSAKTPG